MAKKKDYIITKSNYTISTKHKNIGTNSVIRERDYMAIGGNGSFSNTSLPYGESNFKMTISSKSNSLRSHKYGDWISVDGNEVLTIDNLPAESSNDSKIELKPNYNSMLDFAYFGSCVELLEITIKQIISKFPAELYVTNYPSLYVDKDGNSRNLGDDIFDNPVVIDNPFGIDLSTNKLKVDDDENVLRYFSLSRQHYNILDADENIIECAPKWEVIYENKKCYSDGDKISEIILSDDFIIYEFMLYGKRVLITDGKYEGYHIRPGSAQIEAFFNGLTDFGKMLLNRDSKPLYTASLEYITETEYGLRKFIKKCTWPSTYNWNIDISTFEYNEYVDILYNLANICDEYKTDNLWKMLVHDSIKTMDHTFVNEKTNEDKDDFVLGTTKFKTLLSVYAAFFDYLKRHIDNIKYINNITYNEFNNLPDYFLSDALNLRGWEVNNTTLTLDQSEKITSLFSGESRQYNASDANIAFMRNLQINSNNIFSRKGTRAAIEMVLGLFGYLSDDFTRNLDGSKGDYRIEEYVVVAQSTEKTDIDNELDVQKFNKLKSSYVEEDNSDEESIQGLPIKIVYFQSEDGSTFKYIIPWFDNVSEIDGYPYFQMYGGWGKMKNKTINQTELAPKISYISENKNCSLYDETIKYLHIVRDISELTSIAYGDLINGDIYYVYDISDYELYYNHKPNDNTSHYFVINDKEFCAEFNNKGWENVAVEDIESAKGFGVKVLYLESLIDKCEGNNPHIGYGKYDDGKAYLEHFSQLFKYSIENDNFTDDAYTCENGEIIDGIKNCGFRLSDFIVDNIKTWYFTDKYTQNNRLYQIELDGSKNIYSLNEMDKIAVGKEAKLWGTSNLVPYDFETNTNGNTESAANSVINVKNLKITFMNNESSEPEFKDYFNKCILPYLTQVIPSTTIVEYDIEIEGVDFVCQKILPVAGITN